MKHLFLFAVSLIGLSCYAQIWNYDNQGMIYSTPQTVTIGLSNPPIGNYSPDGRAIELYSPTFTDLLLKSGSYTMQLINSTLYGNSLALPNNQPFSINMSGAPAPAFRVQTNGNIAIGTTLNPSAYKLAVGGKIIAEELKVMLQTAPWPDYVFNNDYILPTINEVEKQIKLEGHLNHMPSASEINCEGFEVGELTRLQQEKIEELTLYIIELNKKIEALDSQMQILGSKTN